MAIDRTELALLVGPFVPDRDALLLEPAHIGVSGEKPEELVDDGLQMQLLGGDQWEALRQIEAHLVAEDGQCAGSGAVALFQALLEHAFPQIVIVAHNPVVRSDSRSQSSSCGNPDPNLHRIMAIN